MEYNIKGKVKCFSEFSFEPQDFSSDEIGILKREFEWENDFKISYDEKGQEIENCEYDSEGNLLVRKTFEYNKKGNLFKVKEYNSSTELKSNTFFKYNKSDLLIEEKTYDKNEKIMNISYYKYDINGNIVESKSQASFNDSNEAGFENETFNLYDKNGNKIEMKVLTSLNGSILTNIISNLEFNENGKKIKVYREVKTSYSNNDTSSVSRYDEKGDLIEYFYYDSKGVLISQENFKYDSNRNIIEEHELNSNTRPNSKNPSLKRKYKYEFDENGNWTKQIILNRMNFREFILLRKLEYYI